MRALVLTGMLAAVTLSIPPAATQGVTATSRAGTSFEGASRQGAYARHSGVQEFGVAADGQSRG